MNFESIAKQRLSSFFILALPLIVPSSASATLQYVLAGGTPIQTFVDAAAPGDTLYMLGVFRGPGNRAIDPAGKDLVFRGYSGVPATVLDCEGFPGFLLTGGETGATVVERITFTGADRAVVCDGAVAPVLQDLVFSSNTAMPAESGEGAAVWIGNGATPTLRRCFFDGNSSFRGGAVFVGAGGSPILTDLEFAGNDAAFGGALCVHGASATLSSILFAGNSAVPRLDSGAQMAGGQGGALHIQSSAVAISNTAFDGNAADFVLGDDPVGGLGGGIYLRGAVPVTLTGSTLNAGQAASGGGGIYMESGTALDVQKTIVAFNLSGGGLYGGGGTSMLAISCSDVFGNGGGDYAGAFNDQTGIAGNISEDPVFCGSDAPAFPLSLNEFSPCVPANNGCGFLMGRYPVGCFGSASVLLVPSEYPNIQAALDAASTGDTVLVAPGVYAGSGNRDLDFGGDDVVLISSGGPAVTIIACGGLGRAFHFHGGEGPVAKVGGFGIYGGSADRGGAILCEGSSPTLENLTLTLGQATLSGGAVALRSGSSPSLLDIRITGNGSGGDGGAISCEQDCSPYLWKLVIYDNTAAGDGGAISCSGNASPTLLRGTIAFNSAAGSGGAVATRGSSQVLLERVNLAFAQSGGGVYSSESSAVNLNCSNVFGNEGGDFLGTATDQTGQDGNLSADPRFCEIAGRDLELDQSSPCAAANNACGVSIGALGVGCSLPFHEISGRVEIDGGGPLAGVELRGYYYKVHSDAAGEYEFLVRDGWNGTLVPEREGYYFTPHWITFPPVHADQTERNFLASLVTLHIVPDDFGSLAAALAAALDGDTILVRAGTYSGASNRNLDFGARNLALIGEGGSENTVIDCDLETRWLNIAGGQSALSLVVGFTIVEGHAQSVGPPNSGGGIRVSGASPTLRDLVFVGCKSRGPGAGLVFGGSNSVVENIRIRNGRAYSVDAGFGGGLACYGGAPVFVDLVLTNNYAHIDGGGIYLSGSAARFSLLTAALNNSDGTGGGIGCNYGSAPLFVQTVVAFNQAASSGGGINVSDGGSAVGWSCSDIWGNFTGNYGGFAVDPTGADGNFSLDPLFCAITQADYTLWSHSPCLPENNSCDLQIGALGEGCTLSAAEFAPVPAGLALGNSPNPFNPATEIRFEMPTAARVSLLVFDLSGREVAALIADAELPAGIHSAQWRGVDAAGRQLPSGIYFVRLSAGEVLLSRKMTLLK